MSPQRPQRDRDGAPDENGKIWYHSKLFDAKHAKELPRYKGDGRGAMWRKKVSNYLITRCPEIRAALSRVERQTAELSLAGVRGAQVRGEFQCRHDVVVLAHHLWGFLNENLEDAAWEILDNSEQQNGLEVWRRIT